MEDSTTQTPAVTARKPWSDSEVTFLKTYASKGAQLLAIELGRSSSQIRSKAMQLGLSLRQPGSTRGRKKTQA